MGVLCMPKHEVLQTSKRARKICTIVTPWGPYTYLSMPTGIIMVIDAFQAKLAGTFTHILHMLVYIDGITIVGYRTFENNIKYAKQVSEYLSFILKTHLINPQPQKLSNYRQSYPQRTRNNSNSSSE